MRDVRILFLICLVLAGCGNPGTEGERMGVSPIEGKNFIEITTETGERNVVASQEEAFQFHAETYPKREFQPILETIQSTIVSYESKKWERLPNSSWMTRIPKERRPKILSSDEAYELRDQNDGWIYLSNVTQGIDLFRFRIKGEPTTAEDFDWEKLNRWRVK